MQIIVCVWVSAWVGVYVMNIEVLDVVSVEMYSVDARSFLAKLVHSIPMKG